MSQVKANPIRSIPPLLREVLWLALLALVYWVTVRIGLLMVVQPDGIATIWPASGLALACLLINPKQRWTKILTVIFIVNVLSNLSGGNSFLISLGFGFVNVLESALCAWALVALRKTKITFHNPKDIFALFSVTIFVSGFTALLGAAIPSFTFGTSFFTAWMIWWVADGTGILLMTPLIVIWRFSPKLRWTVYPPKLLEIFLLFSSLALFSWLIFGSFTVAEQPVLGSYILFPFLIWLSFRFSPRSMITALFLIACIALAGSLQHYGIFAYEDLSTTEELIFLQNYLVVITFSGLLLSAIMTERQQTAEILKIAEANYRSIVENAPLGFFQSYPEGGYRSVNPRMAQIFGFTAPAEMQNEITDISQQIYADPAIRQEFKRQLMVDGRVVNFVTQYRRKDGSPFWTSTNARVIHNELGQPLYYEGFLQDIDGAIKAEKAIQESQKFVQATMDSLSAHICVLEADGTILAVNQAWRDFAEQNPPAIANGGVGFNFLKICDATTGSEAQMAQEFAAGIRAVMAGERESFDLEYPCHAPYEQRWFIGRVMRFADPISQRVVISHQNITERKLAENALRESEASLKLSERVSHVGNWTWDAITNHVTFSDEMYRIFGLNPTTFDGNLDTLISDAVHPEDREKVYESRNSTYNKQKPIPLQHRIILPDQSIRIVWAEAGESVYDENGKIIKLSGIMQDITERKLAENALRESEASLKFSQQVAHVGHWTWDTVSNRVAWSDEMYRIFGLDPATFDGDLDKVIAQAIHPEDREKVIQSNSTVLTEQKPVPLEYRVIWPDQSVHTVWAEAGTSVRDANGKIIKLSGIVQDITERKRTENALHESQQFVMTIADNLPGMIGYWTKDLHCGFANKEYFAWFGRTPKQMLGIAMQELFGDDLFEENKPNVLAVLRGETQKFERSLTKPTGELGYLWAQYIPNWVDGEVQGFFVLTTDITQIKRDQERLRASEEKWRSLFAILPVGITIMDAERKVVDSNPALAEIFKMTPDDLRESDLSRQKYLRADGSAMLPEEFPSVRAVQKQTIIQSVQIGVVKEDNTIIWTEVSAAPLDLPDAACVVVTTDVTRRKQMELALQQANDRLSLAQRAAGAGVWDWDISSNSFNWSPELFDLFEVDPTITPTIEIWFNVIHEQDLQLTRERFGKINSNTRSPINSEYRIVRPSGEIRWINILGDTIYDADDKPQRMSGICIDITSRKQAEAALNESERNIRIFFDTMAEGMALNEIVYDENGEMVDYRILDVNPAFYSTADFNNNIDVIGGLATQLYGMSREMIRGFWEGHKNRRTTANVELFSPLGHKWFYISTSPYFEDKFVTSFLDITQQKEREEQLVQANESLSLAQRAAGAGMWDWDLTQDFFNWSPELYELFGVDPAITPTANTWLRIIHEQDRQYAAEYLNVAIHTHSLIQYEYRVLLPSGATRWINFIGRTKWNEHDEPERVSGICIDITARKQAEDARIESEARLQGIVTSAMDGIVMVDNDQRIILFNDAAEKMFGRPASKVLGQPLDFILPQDKSNIHRKHIQRFGETRITTRSMNALMDITAARATGETFPLEASISQFIVAGQKFYTAIVRDVTERKQIEKDLRASLLEKEVLLKEVHHRVKNNLQIVSSLLSMQASGAKDEKVSQALEESKNRVRAMALIHEKLYRSESLEYIQAEEYIPELINHLGSSMVGFRKDRIQFDLQITTATLDIGKAIPCGMIITELISNALKYAFPQGQQGTIRVHLEKELGTGKIKLMVSDDGVGLPPELDFNHPDTLGLELVSILSRQLKAELQVIRQPGVTYILTFRN